MVIHYGLLRQGKALVVSRDKIHEDLSQWLWSKDYATLHRYSTKVLVEMFITETYKAKAETAQVLYDLWILCRVMIAGFEKWLKHLIDILEFEEVLYPAYLEYLKNPLDAVIKYGGNPCYYFRKIKTLALKN